MKHLMYRPNSLNRSQLDDTAKTIGADIGIVISAIFIGLFIRRNR